MINTDVQIEQISPLENHTRYISEQPKDRHLIEITDENESVFVNAGIDSTCGKKRAAVIHKFSNGTVASSNIAGSVQVPVANLLDALNLNHSAELETNGEPSMSACGPDTHNHECCSQCGK